MQAFTVIATSAEFPAEAILYLDARQALRRIALARPLNGAESARLHLAPIENRVPVIVEKPVQFKRGETVVCAAVNAAQRGALAPADSAAAIEVREAVRAKSEAVAAGAEATAGAERKAIAERADIRARGKALDKAKADAKAKEARKPAGLMNGEKPGAAGKPGSGTRIMGALEQPARRGTRALGGLAS